MMNKLFSKAGNWLNTKKLSIKKVFCILLCVAFFANTLILPQNIFAADSDFLIAKSVDQSVVYPGENFTYTIQYSNPDILNNAINTVITDVLPANVVYVTAEGSSHIASIENMGSPGSETVVFHFIETLPAGSTGILHITCKFPEGTSIGGAANQAVNSATIVSDNKPLITSNEVIVTPLTVAPNWSIQKTKIIPSTVPALDNSVTYQISVTGNSTLGGLNMNNVVITDTLPTDAVYVSSSGGGVYDSGTGTVTFPTIATLAVGQSVSRTITLLYPSPTFTVASSVTNQATATGTPLGETDPVTITTDITHGFTEPVFAIGNFSKTARQTNDRYSIGQQAIFYMNGIANTGNVPLDQFVLEDAIPGIIDLNSVTTGSYNQDVHVEVYYKTDIQTDYVLWTELDNPANTQLTVAGISPALAVGEVITHVKWIITAAGGILPGFSILNSITLRATVITPSGTDITNTADLTAIRGVETLTDTSSKQIFVIDAMPWLAPAKSVRLSGVGNFADHVTVNMRDTLEFRLRIQNNYFATGNLIDPIAVDVLPAELENITFDRYETSAGIVLDEPVASVVDGKWVFAFTGTLLPGQYVDVFYTARVKDQTSVGLYTNKLYLSTKENATEYENDPGSLIVDATDLDGDSSTTDKFVQDNATFFVKFSGSLNSQKLMRGSLDSDWTQYPNLGSTLPGGVSDYRINLTNDGSNGPISNIVIVDELPDIGDYSVLGSTTRLSSWRPYLVNTITFRYFNALGVEVSFPAESQILCYYSTSASVTHNELYDPINGSSDASWSLTPPDDITTVRALKFEIKNLELAKSEKITVEFPMRAPIDSPVGSTAWNSFAYGATYESYANDVLVDAAFLPSEPLKVGYVVANPADYSHTIGDRIWEDMNKNGLQDLDEPGINGVLVNLYDTDDNLVSYTRSGDNQAGEAGYYLFPNVPAGDYYLEFVYPTSYQVTDYHTGADATIDSDLDETLVLPATDLGVAKNAIKTDTLTLSADNLTLDAGLYQYAELGNFVWNDRDADGIQDAGEPGSAGVQVQLLDGDDNVLQTTTTDVNGYYLFSDVDPGNYKVKVTNPSDHYAFSPANAGGDDTDDSDGIVAGDGLSATTGVITLVSAQSDLTIDQGIYLGQIGDFVFHDLNANGIREGGDLGIGGVTVNLYASDGTTLLLTTTTDSNGYYLFEDLIPADYVVGVVLPGTYNRITLQNAGADDTLDSDFDRSTGKTAAITIDIGERDLTIDAGLYKYATIGNYVWNDRDADGVQDGGEPAIVGATVELLNAADDSQAVDDNGTPVAPTVTNASGNYSFGTLTPGSYKVKFTNPGGDYGISPANAGGNDATDSDGIAAGDSLSTMTGSYMLTSGQSNTTVDQGFYLGRIGDLVFHDLNANGIKEAGDIGIIGITVKLYAADGITLLQTTATNASGLYYFEDIYAGSYIVEFSSFGLYNRITLQNQGDDAADSDADRTTGRSGLIAIAIGERNLTIDAGLYKYATIGNFVWNDRDADGVQDGGEPAIVGATVELLNAADDSQAVDDNGTPVAPTVTNASGNYSFGTLTPGSYKVKFTNPGGDYGISPANTGGNDATDSDGIAAGDSLSTTTGSYTLISAQTNTTVDQGFYLGRIGDLVFHDLNANGIKEAGDVGITGITVKLYAADGTTLLQTTATNASGLYYFEDIYAGSYIVEFSSFGLYNRITLQNQGADDAADSDADRTTGRSGLIAIAIGERNLTVDAGLYKYASIGDKTWFDLDADGVQDGGESALPGVTVHLLNSDGSPASDDNGTLVAPAVTNASGIYGFGTLTPGSYKLQFDLPTIEYRYSPINTTTALIDSDVIFATGLTAATTLVSAESDISWDAGFYKAVIGDFVFEDKDADGIQDGGEPGLPNVSVELWLSDGLGGWTYSQQTTTDANGLYTFTQLDSGIYQVRFISPGVTWYITPANQGANDAVDSDQNASGYSGDIDMTIGESDKTIDAGFYRLASVGDRVWNDLDADGVQDGGEVGIPGITVNLAGPNALSLQTTTDASGNYSFTGLVPGIYTVTIDESSLPFAGYETYELDGTLNHSTTVTLISNDARTDVDFGYAYLTSIGDLIWEDFDADGRQDGGEPGLSGVTVQLLNAADAVLDTTVTDSYGTYLFDQLAVGSYKIKAVIPANWLVSPQNIGADDAIDSDAAAGGATGLYSLTSGADNTTADVGLYLPPSIGDTVWLDQNGNGIQDEVDEGFANVTVQLLNGVGTLLDTTITDANGQYLFEGLTPGTYQIRVLLPDGYGFTVQNAASATDSTDSDVVHTTGYGAQTTLISSENDLTHDAGLVKPEIQLAKQLYAGTYDAGQTPLDSLSIMQGQPVTYLFIVTNTGDSYLTAADIDDATLGITDADMTLATGNEPLAPGESMTFYYETTMNRDLVNTATVSANPCAPDGSDLPGLTNPEDTDSASRFALSSIGDFVWNDIDGDGIQDGGEPAFPGVKVVLTNGEGPVAETTTDTDGQYLFDDLIPDTYTVTIDITTLPAKYYNSYEQDGTLNNAVDVVLGDGDIRTDIDFGYYILASIGDRVWHDQNANGLQDDGEPGLSGMTLQLLDSVDNILDVTLTDENGNYVFADLAVGSYRVALVVPADWTVSPVLAGADDAADSDIETGHQTRLLSLVGGQDLTTIDAGLYQMASIGDKIWLDINRDGTQQVEELGIADVQINLLNSVGDTVANTSSDADGLYSFTGLTPASYRIEVVKPAKMAFAAMNQADDTLDSDVDTAGRSSMTVLASGEVNNTVDAGLYNVIVFPGIVINDDGIPVGGAVVIIVDEDGEKIGEVISDPDGHFVFDVPINIVITIIITKPGYDEKRTVVNIEDEDYALANYIIEDQVLPVTGELGENWPFSLLLLSLATLAFIFRRRQKKLSDVQR